MTDKNARKYLVNYYDSDLSFPFMTSTINVSNEFSHLCPAVTHIDGTARPQVVTEAKDPWLFDLLNSWFKISGEPSLINTSFNKHEEPIVATYKEAFSNLQDNVIDVLILDNWVIKKRNV